MVCKRAIQAGFVTEDPELAPKLATYVTETSFHYLIH